MKERIDNIRVERQIERTIYRWREPWQWIGDVGWYLFITALISAPQVLPPRDYAPKYSRYPALIVVFVFLIIDLLWSWLARKRQKVEISRDGLQIGRDRSARRRRVKTVLLDKVMGTKVIRVGFFRSWAVLVMAPGEQGWIATGKLCSKQDAEWLARAIEEEARALGAELQSWGGYSKRSKPRNNTEHTEEFNPRLSFSVFSVFRGYLWKNFLPQRGAKVAKKSLTTQAFCVFDRSILRKSAFFPRISSIS